MNDSPENPQAPDASATDTRESAPLTGDDFWKRVLAMAGPLAQLIGAKREQFRIASNSESLEMIYREDALKQAARLDEAEVFWCKGLQIFKQALSVCYLLPPETKTPSLIEQLSVSSLIN